MKQTLPILVIIGTLSVKLCQTKEKKSAPTPYPVYHYYHEEPLDYDPFSITPQGQEYAPAPRIDDRFGGFLPAPFPTGFGSPAPPPQQPAASPNGYGYGQAGPYPGGAPPPYGFPDPGFQTQTGFEGLLVPNTWYGLLPWGVEGIIIVIAGIIVFAIVIIAIIGLIAWFCGIKRSIGPLLVSKEPAAAGRALLNQGSQLEQKLNNLSSSILSAIDKYNEIDHDISYNKSKVSTESQ